MFSFPVHDYQQQLIVAALDDFTPNATLSNYFGGQYGSNRNVWRRTVLAFLNVNLRCGLIEATHRPELSQDTDGRALDVLLTRGDAERDLPVDVVWDVLYFNGTNKLNDMLDAVNMRRWECMSLGPNKQLIAELTNMYERIA